MKNAKNKIIPDSTIEISLGLPRRARLNPIGFNLSALRANFVRLQNKQAKFGVIVIFFLLIFLGRFCFVFAQGNSEKISLLTQQIEKSNSPIELQPKFEELINLYAKENKFNDFFSFLGGLEKNKIFKDSPFTYYYKALARFKQMQFLEENKAWEELFNNKDLYLGDLNKSLEAAKKINPSANPLALKIKLLEFAVNKDDEKLSVLILEELLSLVSEYANTGGDSAVIKDIADLLTKEKQLIYAKRVYDIYVSKISKSEASQQEIKKLADSFFEEGEIDLAISLYDVYIDKLITAQKKENIQLTDIFDIADKFINSGLKDAVEPSYAETVYERIESLYGSAAFDEIAQYKRAYNLERIKEYGSCFKEYLKLVNNFPKYEDKDKIYFRLGLFSVYVFNKIEQAYDYFSKVVNPIRNTEQTENDAIISNGVNEFSQSNDYLNSLYQLGLLNQWQNNFDKARRYYLIILDKTKDAGAKPEIAVLAEYRLKEIEENKGIDYNLKMFLDVSLKNIQENPSLQLKLFAKPAKSYIAEAVDFRVNSYLADTGCLQQDYAYLWSGQLGENQNPFNASEFKTSYKNSGAKVVNVVLVDSSGLAKGVFEIADIYGSGE